MRFVVIESTPGYMPDDDDPFTTDDYAAAVAHLNELAAGYADDPDGNYEVTYGLASSANLAAVSVADLDKIHDLGRWIAIEIDEGDEEPEPDDEPAPDEPDDQDDFITDARDGYSVSSCGRHVGTFSSERRAEAALYLERARSSYWPNVWRINERGNATLCVFDGHILRATEIGFV
jgi:hypothetical protein